MKTAFAFVNPTAGNEFFAVWVDRTNFSGGVDSIIARKFDSLGNPLTGQVNLTPQFTGFDLTEPAAVRLPIAGQADGLAVAFTRILLPLTTIYFWSGRTRTWVVYN